MFIFYGGFYAWIHKSLQTQTVYLRIYAENTQIYVFMHKNSLKIYVSMYLGSLH